MFKKILALLLTMLIMLSFSACGGAAEEDGGETTTPTVTISVTATSQTVEVLMNTDLETSIILNGSSASNSTLTYTKLSNVSNGTLTLVPNSDNRSYTYLPNPGFEGTDSFTFKVNDGTEDSEVATVTINVSDPAPIVSFSQTITVYLGDITYISPTIEDNEALSISDVLIDGVSIGTCPAIATNNCLLGYTPEALGDYNVSVSITDSVGQITIASTTMSVIPALTFAPIASLTTSNKTYNNRDLNLTIKGTDYDGNVTTITIITAPSNGTLTLLSATSYDDLYHSYKHTDFNYTYSPATNYDGNDSFSYKVNDGVEDSTVVTTTLQVIKAIEHNGFVYVEVNSTHTDRTWLDRNLGATDVGELGDYYQWGRKTDGHEKATSIVTGATSASYLDTGHSDFISHNIDWLDAGVDDSGLLRSSQWGLSDGTGICPSGYRVPTVLEYQAEYQDPTPVAYPVDDLLNGVFNLPSGMRNKDGSTTTGVHVWTLTRVGDFTPQGIRYIGVFEVWDAQFPYGLQVRCIKN